MHFSKVHFSLLLKIGLLGIWVKTTLCLLCIDLKEVIYHFPFQVFKSM